MPFSSLDSTLCHVSSSLISRRVALRDEDEEWDVVDMKTELEMECAGGCRGEGSIGEGLLLLFFVPLPSASQNRESNMRLLVLLPRYQSLCYELESEVSRQWLGRDMEFSN